ncbi:hypothetical protein A3K73_09465 [Candidatus Pacearchaeota archaeon RBG_13_36_9]|nr:MAG: hypothetical protein A3K73_09465 [Candidatus Pacearchaeota archaeon RBG_13_36_9]
MNKVIKSIKKNYGLYGLILILLFAFFLRVYSLGKPPLWVDEATSSMAAKMILEKGVPVFDSGLLYGRAYFFHYVQAFFLLFGENDFFARFPSVIFGLLTVMLAYFIGKEYSKSGGLIAALFTAVFYLEVFYSRQARFYQLFQLLFFSSLYFLYKSKENPKWLYLATVSFILCLDTQIAGLVLAPFFIIHIIVYNKKYYRLFSIIPGMYLIKKFIPAKSLSSEETTINYASQYFSFTGNMRYLLILFIPGVVWAFLKKKRLTLLMVLPSVVMLAGIFSLKTFALRYAYFFAFPLILYTSLLFSFLYEKLGKFMLIAIFLVLIVPSNLIYPQTYVNLILPIDYNYNDYSAPEISLKEIPENIQQALKENTAITYFSSGFEWYIKKPDFAIGFSMDGRGKDQISYNTSDGRTVDVYSGAPILSAAPEKPYYLVADDFSTSKLKEEQKEFLEKATEGCEIVYENRDLKVFECLNEDEARVARVIDGDTFELEGGEIVRLICIDAPEQGEEGAEEAKAYVEELILNRIVRLEKDVSETDAYGRLLRYVYTGDLFVNKEMVSRGYAEVWRYGNDTKKCDEIEG